MPSPSPSHTHASTAALPPRKTSHPEMLQSLYAIGAMRAIRRFGRLVGGLSYSHSVVPRPPTPDPRPRCVLPDHSSSKQQTHRQSACAMMHISSAGLASRCRLPQPPLRPWLSICTMAIHLSGSAPPTPSQQQIQVQRQSDIPREREAEREAAPWLAICGASHHPARPRRVLAENFDAVGKHSKLPRLLMLENHPFTDTTRQIVADSCAWRVFGG